MSNNGSGQNSITCLTYGESLSFSSPALSNPCGQMRVCEPKCRVKECVSHNNKLRLFKVFSPATGKQTALIVGNRNNRCGCRCRKKHRR